VTQTDALFADQSQSILG